MPAWVLGTRFHPDPVKDQKHTLFPAPAYTCSHVFPQATSSRAWLTDCCSVQPPEGTWGTWFCLGEAGETGYT